MAKSASDPTLRVIGHMNKDHHDSVVRYLEAFHSVSSPIAQFATISSMQPTHLTITALGSTYRVPFDPPLKADYSDARQRLVALDQDCIAKLGRDPVTIKKYTLPAGVGQTSVAVVCLFTFVLLARRETLAPGADSPLRPLADKFPGVFENLWKAQPWVFYPLAAIHTFESFWMGRTRLAKHSIPTFSPLWFTWSLSTLIEGFGSFERFDDMVKADKEKTKAH